MRPLVWTTAALVGAILWVFASNGYPPPGSDAPSFLPSAINLDLGRGLTNPFYPRITDADPTGQERHLYYPPLFPLVIRLLMPSPTPSGAFQAVALLRIASLMMSVLLFSRLVNAAGASWNWSLALLIAASLCGLSTSWLPTIGRPEALGTLLVLAAALTALPRPARPPALLWGLFAGLLAATHPFGALELLILMGLYLTAVATPRRALGLTCLVIFEALLVFLIVLALSPYGITENLAGMARAYMLATWSAPPGPEWWRPWLLSRKSTFYGLLVLSSLGCGAHLLLRCRARIRSPAAFLIFALLLGGAIYHGSLTHQSLRNYNALILSPLLYGVVVFWWARSYSWKASVRATWARVACASCVLATCVGFVGYLVFFRVFLNEGMGLEEARAEWRKLSLPATAPIAIVGNTWVLSEDYHRMKFRTLSALSDPSRWRPILVLGRRRYDVTAPNVSGFVLVEDHFNPALPRLRGAAGYFVEEDYSFAVYHSEGVAARADRPLPATDPAPTSP